MRKLLLNECRLDITLSSPAGTRLLIAEAEREQASSEGQQITVSVSDGERAYIPGSSLKGALRNRAEYIANTINSFGLGSCHLFADSESKEESERLACGNRFNIRAEKAERGKGKLTMPQRYGEACPACQLFGHTFWAGRLQLTDFMAAQPVQTVEQPHIAVDRVTSGVASDERGSGKLYKMKYITQATFTGTIMIENFSLWQLGWLGFLLRDLEDGLIRVGHKQTGGGGRLAIDEASARLRYLAGGKPPSETLWGVGRLLQPEDRQAYSYDHEDLAVTIPAVPWRSTGIWHEATLESTDLDALWQATGPLAAAYLKQFQYLPEMSLPALEALQSGQGAPQEAV